MTIVLLAMSVPEPSVSSDRAAEQNQQIDASFREAVLEHDAVKISELLSKQSPKRIDILMDLAIEANDVAIVKLLLRHGADPNAYANSETGTPLMAAAVKGHAEIIEQLLRVGADPNGRSGFNGRAFNALMLAVDWGHHKATYTLLKGGADPNVAVNVGTDAPSTPLMLAAYRANLEIARLLLDSGADSNVKDAKGRRAADWLKKFKSPIPELRELLRQSTDVR